MNNIQKLAELLDATNKDSKQAPERHRKHKQTKKRGDGVVQSTRHNDLEDVLVKNNVDKETDTKIACKRATYDQSMDSYAKGQ